MKKPIVFFSHSSKYKKFLARLKDMVVKKTGNSIDIFLSSDGESIPLGRNWVHTIQKALEEASLMFVFISPHSLRSNWLFFESGFAYSRGIKVVPVGILGVDLGTLPPPLSLLQGFNVTSAESLGNIIALLNETFSHNHQTQFSTTEFEELYPKGEDAAFSALGEYSTLSSDISIEIKNDELKYEKDELVNKEIEILKNAGIEFQQSSTGYNIFTYGFSIKNSSASLAIKIDPDLSAFTFPIVEKFISSIRTNGVMGILLNLSFKGVNFIGELHKIAARIYNTDIKIGEEDGFFKGCVKFKIIPPWLLVECKCKTFAEMKLDELLNLLFERRILYVAE